MKKTFFLYCIALAFLVACNAKQSEKDANSFEKTYTVKSTYLLLPIEDTAPEVKVTVKYPDGETSPMYWIRFAEKKIDYWVKLDLKEFKGKKVALSFEDASNSHFGINQIKQGDKLDYNYDETYRPSFHFTPPYGWMNDPNGMVYLDGEYHLFYQYNPYGATWGNMHWGHAVSTDLTSWTYLPVAIGPDSLGTIFSGSAVIDKNNTAGFGQNALVAIYTSAGAVQSQSIAYSTDKGRTFTKYEGNPVIPNDGIPDFRDPKVFWHDASNQWVMSLATKQTITFYGSPNLKEWTRLSEFGEGIGGHGGVWECPDLFPLTYQGKTKWVLLVSINPGGPNGGSATQYFIGNFDGKSFKPDALPYPLWLDYGRDNYAGVTWSDIPESDGRKIFIGWMSNWDYANQVPSVNFRSAMTVPRELKLTSNGSHLILTNYPVKEVENLRANNVNSIGNFEVEKEHLVEKLQENNDGTYEVEFTLTPSTTNLFGFALENSKNEKLAVKFDKNSKQITMDRKNSGLTAFKDNYPSEMVAPLVVRNDYRIRILVDKASVELFVNQGETVLTSVVFPTEAYNQLRFSAENGKLNVSDLKITNLK